MAAAGDGKQQTATKEKCVYYRDGVFVHTAVPASTHYANIIQGRVKIVEKENKTFVDWSPLPGVVPDDNYDVQSSPSDGHDWNIITHGKQTEDEGGGESESSKDVDSNQEAATQKYSIHFDIKDMHSIRRSDPKLSWSYAVFILKNGNTLPALHFHDGGIKEMIQTLSRYVWLTKSSSNHKLFVVDDTNKALRKSLDQLQILSETASGSGVTRLLNNAYTEGFGALSKVTKLVRDVWNLGMELDTDIHGQLQLPIEAPTGDAGVPAPLSPTTEFEDLIPEGPDLGEVPDVQRCSPLSADEWQSFRAEDGRIERIQELHNKIFHGGVDPDIRREVWKFLLSYHDYNSTTEDKVEHVKDLKLSYHTMKWQWQSIKGRQEEQFSELVNRKSLVEKDVNRTDRMHEAFKGEDNPNLEKLYDILLTYCMYNFDLGYVQGMSDLLAPVLVVMEDEVDAFWCFAGFMDKVKRNFDMDQEGMRHQLYNIGKLIEFIFPKFYHYLDVHHSSNLFFCFRWLLIVFKREFTFPDIMTLWEAIWTQDLSPNFHLFICLAILEEHKTMMMENQFGFNEILKHINDLSYKIDLNKTITRAEALCLQLMSYPHLPSEIREIVTGIKEEPHEDTEDAASEEDTNNRDAIVEEDVLVSLPMIASDDDDDIEVLGASGGSECHKVSPSADHQNHVAAEVVVTQPEAYETENIIIDRATTPDEVNAPMGAIHDDEVVVLSEQAQNVF